HVKAGGTEYVTRAVINAAGVYADEIHNMVSTQKIRIRPRRGEYCLYDRALQGYVRHTIFQLPTEKGKGVLVTPTVHGNILAGPTSDFISDKEDTATTAEGIAEVLEKENLSVKPLPRGKIITYFAGLRAHGEMGDFIIGEAEGAPLFYDLAGIESPGLSSAPAIGEMTAAWAEKALGLQKKDHVIEKRKGIPLFAELPFEEKQKLIEKNPLYGQIVCRCETVTEGEIVDAIRRPLGARSLDGIKRRTRAGMGRCQSGFCLPRVCEILHRETGIPQDMITKCGGNSRVVVGYTKGEKEPRDREDGRHPHEEM
ncbi:NAD(P)/FAD-dependent oxidoreductase, partial [Porcincola intestinalis]|uniref:NAD(P)/FAD-dependent oxidoreductase n=1 Tax=Porcincola intestinalis TaxID=2606632 RepID=UPI002A83CDB1